MLLTSTKELLSPPKNIVSLVPSQTELLFYLGLQNGITGITKFCVHPEESVKCKSKIGGTKNVNINKIIGLQPDLIIANKEENLKQQVEILALDFPVWVTNIDTLEESYIMISDIGNLTNRTIEAEILIKDIANEFSKFPVAGKPIKTCYLIWRKPYMTIGGDTFINDMMQRCGLQNIFNYRSRYPEISFKEIEEHNCELILLPNEPYPFKEKHIEEIKKQLPSVKLILADGEMFSWYGSRLLFSPGYFNKLIINCGI